MRSFFVGVLVFSVIAACSSTSNTPPPNPPPAPTPDPAPAPAPAPAPEEPRTVGNDRDAHGCIPSAGYQWCARENRCVRQWELAQERNLPSGDAAAFQRFCAGN